MPAEYVALLFKARGLVKRLTWSSVIVPNPATFVTRLINFHTITVLDLSENLTITTLNFLTCVRNLTSLSLSNSISIHQKDFVEHISICTELESLDIDPYQRVT